MMPLCLGGAALAALEERRGAVASRRKGNTGRRLRFQKSMVKYEKGCSESPKRNSITITFATILLWERNWIKNPTITGTADLNCSPLGADAFWIFPLVLLKI